MNKIDTIIFDLGGVLIDWNPEYVFRTIFSDEEEMKTFFDNVCTPDWNEQQDAGRTIEDATESLVSQFPNEEQNIRAYYGRWEEMLRGPIDGTVTILKELKDSKKYKLFALTNWSHELFPIALRRFDFLQWFHGRIVSGEEKIRKPFAEIYELIVNRYHINPHNAIYIDDNVRNLTAPEAMGMKTIRFESPGQLREELSLLLN